jgi:hypothetical protein
MNLTLKLISPKAMSKQNLKKSNTSMFFSAFNYKLLGIAVLLIVGGFAAMYLENEVHGFVSLYVSPVVVMAGYVLVIFAIMKHDRQESEEKSTE